MIEPDELVRKTGLTRLHTVHWMPGDNIVISMLGDADGDGACGFAVLDARTFEVKGRWENDGPHPKHATRATVMREGEPGGGERLYGPSPETLSAPCAWMRACHLTRPRTRLGRHAGAVTGMRTASAFTNGSARVAARPD